MDKGYNISREAGHGWTIDGVVDLAFRRLRNFAGWMDGRMDESTDGWTWMDAWRDLLLWKGQEGFKHQEFKKKVCKKTPRFSIQFGHFEWMDGLLSNNLEVNLLIKCKNK